MCGNGYASNQNTLEETVIQNFLKNWIFSDFRWNDDDKRTGLYGGELYRTGNDKGLKGIDSGQRIEDRSSSLQISLAVYTCYNYLNLTQLLHILFYF